MKLPPSTSSTPLTPLLDLKKSLYTHTHTLTGFFSFLFLSTNTQFLRLLISVRNHLIAQAGRSPIF